MLHACIMSVLFNTFFACCIFAVHTQAICVVKSFVTWITYITPFKLRELYMCIKRHYYNYMNATLPSTTRPFSVVHTPLTLYMERNTSSTTNTNKPHMYCSYKRASKVHHHGAVKICQ